MKATKACLLIGLTLALAASAADTGRGIAVEPVASVAPSGNAGLFVGVNQFTEDTTLRPLSFAVNDAIAQAHLFVVELKLVPAANACLALSGEPTGDAAKTQLDALVKAGVQRGGAGRTRIVSSLLRITGMAREREDLVVVSISSHGFEEQGVAYILPSDGLRGALRVTALGLAAVEENMANSKARKRLLLIDACREQPTTDTKDAGTAMSAAFRTALATAEGQAVLASCDAGQLSIENTDLGHGVFTHFLLKAMRGEATADSRGFITLGTVSDYVTQSVRDWVLRNKPGLDTRTAQQPWFKGPKVAEQIPLAVAPSIRARLGAFKQDIDATVSALRGKINRKGDFNTTLYDRLADALEQAHDDEPGRNLLKKSRDFLAGNLDEDAFVAYLVRAFQTSGSQPTRLPQAAAARMEPETSVRPTGPRGMLGVIIQNISPDFKDQFNLSSTNGALVAQINKNSAAERAGVKIGDIIIRFNDKEVEDVSSLRNAVASTAPGARATVVVIRDRRERTLTAQLDELKIEEGRERAKPTEGEAFAAVLGIYVEPLTAEAIKYYRFDETDQGALVRFVDNESPATTAGLFPGDLITEVNREKVANPADFHSALQKTKTKESILLLVTRDKANRFVIIKPKQDK